MPEQDAAQTVAAAAAAAPVAGKPAEVVADAAKIAAESEPKEEATLLGEEGKKDAVVAPPENKVIPEKYDLKIPEGMTLDQVMLDKITPVFKELGLTQEGAQKLADVYAPYISQMMETQQKSAVGEFNKMVGEWKAQTTQELSKDGAKSEVELAHAAKFIDKFGGPELRQILNETGLGNHVAVVKAFVKAGKAIASDSFPDSSQKGKPLDTMEAKAEALYPTSKQT